jgi:uncharacterized membrane protein YecN with MAPEG domain
MVPTIVPFYGALLGALFVLLAVRAIFARRAAQVPIGPLGDEAGDRRVRAHANFAEYVPLALVLLGFAEARGVLAEAVHLGAALLLAGRLAHAWGVSQRPENYSWRRFGMLATGGAYAVAIAALLAGYLPG